MRRRYEATHNPSADHDTDVVHAVATECIEASAVAQIDNQCQRVAHRMMEDTQSGVEGCVDHPPSEHSDQPRFPYLGTHPPPTDLQAVLL